MSMSAEALKVIFKRVISMSFSVSILSQRGHFPLLNTGHIDNQKKNLNVHMCMKLNLNSEATAIDLTYKVIKSSEPC